MLLAVVGEFRLALRTATAVLLLALLLPASTSAVGICADDRSLGMLGLRNRLFALLDLRGEGSLGGRLGGLGSVLSAVNLGRVLRRGQVGQL